MFHIIVVTVVECIFYIPVLTREGCRYFLELLFGHLWVQSVDLHLQADESVLGIEDVAHRLLDGLDAGTRRTEHNGILAFSLRLRQIAIDAVTAVSLYLQQIGIRLVSAILLHFLAVHVYWRLSGFFEILLPEGIEVLRILRIWFQLFR